GVTQFDLVAGFQIVFRKRDLCGLFGRLALLALTDLLTVDVGAVEAAKVTDAGVGRIDVEQAVMPRYGLVVGVVGQLRRTVVGPPQDTRGAVAEDELRPLELSLGDRERDLGRHGGVLVLGRRSWLDLHYTRPSRRQSWG